MKKDSSYSSLRKSFSVLAGSPIWISIVSFIGVIFLQQNLKVDTASSAVLGTGAFAFLFGTSQLTLVLSAKTLNLSFIKGMSSVLSIAIGLLLVFFSYFAAKGRKGFLEGCLVVYGLDTALSVAALIIGGIGNTPIDPGIASYIVSPLLHLIGLVLILYGVILRKKLEAEEGTEEVSTRK